MKFLRKISERQVRPGREMTVLRLLPRAALLGTLAPIAVAVLARLVIDEGSAAEVAKRVRTVDIFCIAAAVTAWTAVATVGIGGFIVYVMKGPSYAADSYEISHADRPDRHDRSRER